MQPTTSSTSPHRPIPSAWVDSLFTRMGALYGAKFADMWGSSDIAAVKGLWAQELGKLTKEELANGVQKLMDHEWPPSLPAFIKLCKPPMEPVRAYYEALAGIKAREDGEVGEWSHPAVYWAMVKIGAYDLKNLSFSAVRDRWVATLDSVMAQGQWEPIPAPSLALPAPGKTKLSNEEAAKRLGELNASGVFKPQNDEKRWAKRILERDKRGDKTLLPIQVKFAREAREVKEAA